MAQSSKQPSQRVLGSLPMAIALDKSGSTYGRTLEVEVQVVQQLCKLRLPNNKNPIHLLPWCGEALDPIQLPDNTQAMMKLTGEGSTDPSVLYTSDNCLKTLEASGVWFLLTDGEIYDSLVENFAVKIVQVGHHSKPCVIIVFGDTSRGRPAACNISVGIAVYAAVPDCLFLFHDIPTGIVRAMQAKGKFKELLPAVGNERVQPVVTKYTAWAELPRISYERLAEICLGEAVKLQRDELQLQGGAVIKLDDLLAGKTDPQTVEQIIKNDDDLKSIVLASMTRGTGKDVEAWLEAQQLPLPQRTSHPQDFSGRAQKAVDSILRAIRARTVKNALDDLRAELRSAHHDNLKRCQGLIFDETVAERQVRAWNVRVRNGINMNHLFVPSGDGYMTHNTLCNDMGFRDDYEMKLIRGRDNQDNLDPVCFPGFQRRKPVSEYKGECMLCKANSTLTLLLKSPPNAATENFPREGSYSKLAFPLAMGNFAELDLLSFFVCCDSCAFYLHKSGTNPFQETVIGALCLVCVSANQALWLEAMDQAVKGRFDISDLLTVCLAMVDKKLVENESRDAPEEDKRLFRECAQWTIRHVAQTVEMPATLSAAFEAGKEAEKTTLAKILSREHFASVGAIENVDLLLLRYPIPGFMVLLRLLSLLYVQPDQIQTLLFQRVLFHVMEQITARRMSGELQLPIDEILGLNNGGQTANTANDGNQVGKVSIPIAELVSYGLLDLDSLNTLRNQAEFGAVESQSGPAMAVFLHHLLRYGQVYPTPTGCFNALKVSTAMKKAIIAPLAIGSGLAADLISQL
ncbi:hypothetical protein DL771_002956 [Monosporascus sp. 5C6A]|nr:hypothetical protein DL771_002956 [Monosporascus sp. 5C6A]